MNILNADHYSCKTPDSRSCLSLYTDRFSRESSFIHGKLHLPQAYVPVVSESDPRATRSATSQSVVGLVPRHTYPYNNFVHDFLL